MKTRFLLVGVLLVSAPVFAQVNAPTVPATTEPSGADLLRQAGDKILPGPNGSPSAGEILEPAENLRRQRLAVGRNAPALALVRQALQKRVEIPLSTTYFDTSYLTMGAKARELARQLAQESDVRLADDDFVGAMNSKLDTIELGAQYEHGSLLTWLVGRALEGIGRSDADRIAPHLTAAQCRTAVERLKTIDAERPSYAEVLKKEKQETEILLTSNLANFQKANLTPEGRKAQDMSPAEALIIEALTPDKLRADTANYFAPLIQSAAFPYQQSLTLRSLPIDDPLLNHKSELFLDNNPRFNYERNRTASLLMRAALELRAQKLESGQYPTNFTAPVDPFSPDGKPLMYRKTETGYLLYSVGPDGKDDGGKSIQVPVTNPAGIVTMSDTPQRDSTGDIVQLPF